jgi:hypothetical protein
VFVSLLITLFLIAGVNSYIEVYFKKLKSKAKTGTVEVFVFVSLLITLFLIAGVNSYIEV